MLLTNIRAKNLPKMDVLGSADPYVTFDIAGLEQQRSKVLSLLALIVQAYKY